MKTNNIISTPNITGNIGSCSTQTEKVILRGGFWSEDGQTIATNSCTGEVKMYPYHDIAGSVVWLVLVIIFLVGFITRGIIKRGIY